MSARTKRSAPVAASPVSIRVEQPAAPVEVEDPSPVETPPSAAALEVEDKLADFPAETPLTLSRYDADGVPAFLAKMPVSSFTEQGTAARFGGGKYRLFVRLRDPKTGKLTGEQYTRVFSIDSAAVPVRPATAPAGDGHGGAEVTALQAILASVTSAFAALAEAQRNLPSPMSMLKEFVELQKSVTPSAGRSAMETIKEARAIVALGHELTPEPGEMAEGWTPAAVQALVRETGVGPLVQTIVGKAGAIVERAAAGSAPPPVITPKSPVMSAVAAGPPAPIADFPPRPAGVDSTALRPDLAAAAAAPSGLLQAFITRRLPHILQWAHLGRDAEALGRAEWEQLPTELHDQAIALLSDPELPAQLLAADPRVEAHAGWVDEFLFGMQIQAGLVEEEGESEVQADAAAAVGVSATPAVEPLT